MIETLSRFGWILHKPDDTADIRVFGPCTPENLEEFHELVEVITILQPLATSFAICERAHAVLASLVASQEARLNALTVSRVPVSLALDLVVETSAAVTTFLGAASALLGQAHFQLTKHWGDPSPRYTDWDDRRTALHAGSLGYRLMYELRNYSQHHALPVSSVNVNGTRASHGGRMTFTCCPTLNRDALLSGSYNWRKRRPELAAMSAHFEVLPLLSDYFECLRAIMHKIAISFALELEECARYLSTVHRVLRTPAGADVVIFHGESPSPDVPPAKVTIVPHEQFRWLLKTLQHAAPAAKP